METTECSMVTEGVNMHGLAIKDLQYADNVDLLAKKEEKLQSVIDQLQDSSKEYGLQVNANKSKVMVFGRGTNHHSTINIDTNILDCV